MRNRVVFLDRDGTLNEDSGYTHKVEDFKLLPGVIDGLKKLKDFTLFIITNQSGIGRGYYTEEDMHKYNKRMLDEFEKHDIKIEKIFFCPHSPGEKCDCRKPNLMHIKDAQKQFNIDLERSYVIGDHPADAQMAKQAGCKGIYLLTGHGVNHLKEARESNPDYIAANFLQAIDFILFYKEDKIIARKELTVLVEKIRKEKKKISTINGTFDILHIGHEKILSEAKKQSDILIVGINSDDSVRKNKGPKRPLNNEINRARMLANYHFIDYVTIFGETTPIKLLEIIKPDVHVNGSEYGKECIEAETIRRYGGRMHIVRLLEGYSTSNIITKIG